MAKNRQKHHFNQAFRRLNFVRRYGTFRESQAKYIEATLTDLSKKIKELQEDKKEKEAILAEELNQKKILDKEKKTKNILVSDLKKKQKGLKDDIKKKQREADKLNAQITEIIQREIAAAANKNTTNKSSTAFKNTPEYKNLSNKFTENKGKLPWPVEKGFISKRFGKYNHPDLDKVVLENNGIDIRTEHGASVRAIYKGKVISIISNPTYKNAVIINHGEYFTVYTNLDHIMVHTNQEVKTKQKIGFAYTNSETNITEVHLEVWKGNIKLNPAYWLFKK